MPCVRLLDNNRHLSRHSTATSILPLVVLLSTHLNYVHAYVQPTASSTNVQKLRNTTISIIAYRKAEEPPQQPKNHGEKENNNRAQALRNARRPLQDDVWYRRLRRGGGRRATTAEQACELAPVLESVDRSTFVSICSVPSSA